MSFISPLDRLSDKFNIITHNTRELLNKLSIWSSSTDDYIELILKVEDEPYFEQYRIPTLSFIKNNRVSSWENHKPTGTKYWGSSLTSSDYLVDDKYVLNLDYLSYPPNHYIEYAGADIEDNLTINLINSGDFGDISSFIIKINPSSINNGGSNFIKFVDGSTGNTLLKLGNYKLLNTNDVPASSSYPLYFKVSFQIINHPAIGKSLAILDLYELPQYEYYLGITSYRSDSFRDPFIQ